MIIVEIGFHLRLVYMAHSVRTFTPSDSDTLSTHAQCPDFHMDSDSKSKRAIEQ